MRHWLQLATRNWRAKPGRAIASTVAIALGVGTVVSITCFYESVRRAVTDQVVNNWLGNSHLTVEPPLGHWGHVQQSLAEPLGDIDNVAEVTYRLRRAMTVTVSAPAEPTTAGPPTAGPRILSRSSVDAIGIEPATEYAFRKYRGVVGRLIEPGERGVAILETASAKEWNLNVGDQIGIAVSDTDESHPFTIVGTYQVRRVAAFQRPTVLLPLIDVQRIKHEPNQVTSVDLMLADPSVVQLERAGRRVREIVAEWNERHGTNWQVSTAATKLQQLREAEQATQLVLMLVAFVALLTSFFIILSTMSMGIVERIAVLGMMRCVGLTRAQLVGLVLTEVLPMGVIGVLAGLPIGLGLTKVGSMLIPEYVEGVVISVWGTGLAVVGGLATVLAAAGILVIQVAHLSPLVAANPEARPARTWLALVAALVGAISLLVHQWMIGSLEAASWLEPAIAFCGVATIYLGYVLPALEVALLAGTIVFHAVACILPATHK